jgi:hypothetical protein
MPEYMLLLYAAEADEAGVRDRWAELPLWLEVTQSLRGLGPLDQIRYSDGVGVDVHDTGVTAGGVDDDPCRPRPVSPTCDLECPGSMADKIMPGVCGHPQDDHRVGVQHADQPNRRTDGVSWHVVGSHRRRSASGSIQCDPDPAL